MIGAVAVLATWAGVPYLDHELASGETDPLAARRYGLLVQLFIAAMATAVLADNLGILWVAVEGTTVVTALLVGFRRNRAAMEAAWKYVIICSVGIGIAFLGTVLVYYAALHGGVPAEHAMDWSALSAHAASLDSNVMRIAMALLLLGFGTKAGLVPMHSWLPDAHGQAPAPVSALMSGVLLAVAFYAILRYKVLADAATGVGFTRTLLIIAALGSLLLAAALLVAQRDYKRMLAYSSIEHMGLVALGAAIGSRLAVAALLLHILGHGLGKAVLFLGSGYIQHATGSTEIRRVRGLLTLRPLLAGTFGVGMLALVGMPPFSVFASEIGIARAGFGAGFGWVTGAAFVLVLIAGAAMMIHTAGMLLGAAPSGPGTTRVPVRTPAVVAVPLVLGLLTVAAVGLFGDLLGGLLEAASLIVGAP